MIVKLSCFELLTKGWRELPAIYFDRLCLLLKHEYKPQHSAHPHHTVVTFCRSELPNYQAHQFIADWRSIFLHLSLARVADNISVTKSDGKAEVFSVILNYTAPSLDLSVEPNQKSNLSKPSQAIVPLLCWEMGIESLLAVHCKPGTIIPTDNANNYHDIFISLWQGCSYTLTGWKLETYFTASRPGKNRDLHYQIWS